jgi:hypothetical protein
MLTGESMLIDKQPRARGARARGRAPRARGRRGPPPGAPTPRPPPPGANPRPPHPRAAPGHRTTYTRPFNQLPKLRRGDLIRLGARSYRVRRTAVIRPWQVWVLRHRGLVLSACHPAGSAAFRYVVVAAPVGS